MYALLTAFTLLFPPPDLSNHWRWSSASVNQSGSDTTPVPSPINPVPNPTPNPVPTPSPTPLKPGDKCPGCKDGWIDSDGSAKVKCWKCNGDGRVDLGDPILTSDVPPLGILSQPTRNGEQEDKVQKTPETKSESKETTGASLPKIPVPITKPPSTNSFFKQSEPNITGPITDPDSRKVCYKPVYSDDGYWLFDPEGKKWVRSSKQPPTYKQVVTGHWETKAYTVCNGRKGCKTTYKKVWVADSPNKVLQSATAYQAKYPIRGSWWTGCSSYRHLLTGPHAGKFDAKYLQSLNWEELQSLHSDDHSGTVKWQYVNQ